MTEPGTREEILKAATAVLNGNGFEHFTLDAVARQAGVSKGGLLYHFPTKEALIEALAHYHTQRREAELAARIADEPPSPGRAMRAYLALTPPEVGLEGLVMIARRPELGAVIEAHLQRVMAILRNDGLDPALVAMLTLVVDGTLLSTVLGLPDPGREVKDQALALARRLTFPGALAADLGPPQR
jgi:AcrR family transcriptional regulator